MTARRRRSPSGPSPASKAPAQLDHLVIMRESALYDHVLMSGMVQQTLAKVAHLPGAEELYAAGMDVFEHPERYGATTRRSGKSRMVMVERDGVLYLYSMGTAAKKDLPEANAFIRELVKIVETYRPADVWVVAFTRLLRSANYVGDLLRAFSEHARAIHCETEINIATPEGRLIFQVLGMVSGVERDYIVRRHTAGRVAQWRRDAWIPSAYPPGYRLEGERLVLDEPNVDAVRQMLRLLADPGLSSSERVARIGGLGISTPGVLRLHGPDATVADARNPSEVLATIEGWLDLYATGRYAVLWPNPFPGVSDVAGVEIQEIDGYEFGAIELAFQVPLPDGGWADDETFDAVRRRRRTRPLTGGASHAMAPPLSGCFEFDDGQHEYALKAMDHAYGLMRRPLLEDRRFRGWLTEPTDAETLLEVERQTLHRSIADAVLAAVRDGLPAELDANRFQSAGPLPRLDARRARRRAVQRQLEEVARDLRRARRNAGLADDDEAAALFIEDVKTHQAHHKQLRQELAELDAAIVEPELGSTFETNAELVAHAIAALANAGDRAEARLREALRTIVSRGRYRVEGNTLHWELHVELPHRDGTVVLGPVRGEVTGRRPLLRNRPSERARRRSAVSEWVAAGLPKRSARSVVACPHPELHEVLQASLAGRPAPEGVDSAWARHIAAVYTDPDFRWGVGQWRLRDGPRRVLLDTIVAAGGRVERDKILAAGVLASQLCYLSRVTVGAPSGGPIVRASRRGRDPEYVLIDCPHCGGYASHSVVTPETRPGVLCPDCWRAPVPDSPVFPEFYRS